MQISFYNLEFSKLCAQTASCNLKKKNVKIKEKRKNIRFEITKLTAAKSSTNIGTTLVIIITCH